MGEDGPSRDEIDRFIRENDVDDRAANDLRDCSGEIQRKVLARGELSTARNPSAAVLARIRDARAGSSFSGGGGGREAPRNSADVEDFIRSNDVDESAADSLRSSSPGVQRQVLSRGELKTARNPSSALLARIRDAKMGGGGGSSLAPLGDSGSGSLGAPPSSMAAFGGTPPAGAYGAYPGFPGYGMYGATPQGTPAGYPAGAYGMYAGYGAYGYPGMQGYAPPSQDGTSPPGYPGYPGMQGMQGMQGMPGMPGMPSYPAVTAGGFGGAPGAAPPAAAGGRGRSPSSSYSRSRSRDRRRGGGRRRR